MNKITTNPFRPGAGHQPPYLAGRIEEKEIFEQLLDQDIVMQNLVLTGLRGIGKTVLLESFKPLALQKKWLWAGTDCSESASVSEETMAIRLLTDIALITSNLKIAEQSHKKIGFNENADTVDIYLNFEFLVGLYKTTPGLPSDKLKKVLTVVWECIKVLDVKGMIFAYDEAQTLSDHAADRQYPLSLLLDVFQYMQKAGAQFMLVLTGLPTLLVRLIETRTYSERLFRVVVLDQLTEAESRDAITKPIEESSHPLKFNEASIGLIIDQSGGYPYFIQFICREVFDVFERQLSNNEELIVPIDAILQKLDNDFFSARWVKATDREKELLTLIAQAGLAEFGVMQVVNLSNQAEIRAFSKSQVSQMLSRLIENGLVYKNRRGSYSFAVPLLERYILRGKK
jgi:Cdc6-like AAA superfamily ATPase